MKRVVLCVVLSLAMMASSAAAVDSDKAPANSEKVRLIKTDVSQMQVMYEVIAVPSVGGIGPIVIVVPQLGGDDPEVEEKTWSEIKRMFI